MLNECVAKFHCGRLAFLGEFWSVKFIERQDSFEVLFRYFKEHGHKRDPKVINILRCPMSRVHMSRALLAHVFQ